MVDGREISSGLLARLRMRGQSLLVSKGERDEAKVEELIRSQPGITRANTVSMISPKGGVGKTTSTFLVGNPLASHLRLRTIAVDANPDFGTLSALAPDRLRPHRQLHGRRQRASGDGRHGPFSLRSLLGSGFTPLGGVGGQDFTRGGRQFKKLVSALDVAGTPASRGRW